MSTKLYVGGLAWATTEQTLHAEFSKAGEVVSVSIITDNGRTKGFGFVEMATPEAAQAAIDMFNGQELEGRSLTVNEARPKAPRSNFGGRNDRSFGGGSGGNDRRGSW